MTDITPELPPIQAETAPQDALLAATPSADDTPQAAPVAETPVVAKPKNRFASVQPVLEKLFELYPHLFGQRFLPLKLGIFQELLAAHPDDFKRDNLKAALGVHTRSTRYLQCVAAGMQRHDLQGKPVEPVAPEHVYLSIIELFQRRQGRTDDDLTPKLRSQLMAAYEACGLSRQDYLARLPATNETITAVLDDAIAEVDQQRARRAALARAFEASGKTVEEFADSLGMAAREVQAALRSQSA